MSVDLPVVDLDAFLADPASPLAREQCRIAAEGLHQFGLLIVRDSRVSDTDNNRFLNMLEAYFEQPEKTLLADAHPELSFEVGSTPSYTELPRDHCARMRLFKDANAPVSLCPPELDPKWRFFWRLGDRPTVTAYAELNAPPVVPAAFPKWAEVMDTWGTQLSSTLLAVSGLAALGFGLPEDTFREFMHLGPHLLAPTGSNFAKFGKLGTVLAGFHYGTMSYNLNLLTIHGKSRFPGLFVWTRDGQRVPVRVPDGCLLIQAGKQFEYLTGGHVLAGFHEVVVSPETLTVIDRRREEGQSLWRVSSTGFFAVASDKVLAPLPHFAASLDPATAAQYPPIDAGEQVRRELAMIKLGSSAHLPVGADPSVAVAVAAAAAAAAGSGAGAATE